VVLATMAAVIASQAVISGAFSMTRQAIQLGFSPRMEIRHTSASTEGQIYMPLVNRMLMVGTIGVVLGFGSATNLAAAYGIAVTGEMIVATILAGAVFGVMWNWPWWLHLVMASFLAIDVCFFGANMLKFVQGGWFPLALGVVIFAVMFTWRRGRGLLLQRLREGSLPLPAFIESLQSSSVTRVPGTAVFMTAEEYGTPTALLHNLKHNKVLHERNVVLRVETLEIPRADDSERIALEQLGGSFWKLRLRFGFAEDANVPRALFSCAQSGLDFEIMDTTFFLSRETLIPSAEKGMPLWQDKLFAFMARNATSATQFFNIPTNRLVELGAQVEI
jgi:KUP system potassium uptake protein